jgi:hypothetical protein
MSEVGDARDGAGVSRVTERTVSLSVCGRGSAAGLEAASHMRHDMCTDGDRTRDGTRATPTARPTPWPTRATTSGDATRAPLFVCLPSALRFVHSVTLYKYILDLVHDGIHTTSYVPTPHCAHHLIRHHVVTTRQPTPTADTVTTVAVRRRTLVAH